MSLLIKKQKEGEEELKLPPHQKSRLEQYQYQETMSFEYIQKLLAILQISSNIIIIKD